MEVMQIKITERDALLLVAALGTYKCRNQQRRKWTKKTRIPRLISHIADYVTAGETEIADKMRRKLEMVRRQNERRGELTDEIERLSVWLKNVSGLSDEKVLENLE